MNDVIRRAASPLHDPPAEFEGRPFFDETVTLLSSVRDHDFDTAGRIGLRIMRLRLTRISSILAR